MAVSTTSSTGTMLTYVQKKYRLDELRLHDDPSFGTSTLFARRGEHALTMPLMKSDPESLMKVMGTIMKTIQSELGKFEADLRYNAIEGMNDFIQLMSREREKMSAVDSAILTPEQVHTLEADMQMKGSSMYGGPVRTIMGYEIIIENQD